MAFQTHWNRFVKTILPAQTNSGDMHLARLAYTWGREDAAVEIRVEDERRLAGQLNSLGVPSNEGQSPG